MARGKRLGTPANLRNHDLGRARGRATRTEKALRHARDLAPIIADLRASGATSLSAIAAGLNERGIPTARELNDRGIPPTSREGRWSAVQVKRVVERLSC